MKYEQDKEWYRSRGVVGGRLGLALGIASIVVGLALTNGFIDSDTAAAITSILGILSAFAGETAAQGRLTANSRIKGAKNASG